MSFDPQQFMDSVYTESNSTEIIPVDEGEYQAIAENADVKSFSGVKDPSKTYIQLTVNWRLDDEAQRQKTKRDNILIRQQIFLDTTPNGMLDMGEGKNVGLGRLRAALGLNKPGVPFRFSDIPGRAAKVKVKMREVEDKKFEEVTAVAAL